MARDMDLEARIEQALAANRNIVRKAMFGGVAWLMDGHLVLAASRKGLLARLGPDGEAWALDFTDVRRMAMGGREMPGWVRAGEDACADDEIFPALVARAMAFVRTLPARPERKPKPRPPRRKA
jgi:hypothetical protein